MSHYFENDNNLKSEIKDFDVDILNYHFTFSTDNGVFSKGELDYGTYLLIKNVLKLNIQGSILDLGCGYGPIGIILEKILNLDVSMCDINKRAVHLSKMNVKRNGVNAIVLESDGYINIQGKYDYIVSNPPIRVGKKNLYQLLIDGRSYLNENGEILIVVRKEQGALSLIHDMSVYYDVKVLDKSKGFLIISLKKC